MPTFLLLYERLASELGSWRPLLQQQAVLAAARAVLTHDRSEEPALSEHRLLAPCNLDILPLLAITARDYASFGEPEGTERHRPPITLYHDDTWPAETLEADDEMRKLLHPAWFDPPTLDLRSTILEFRPKVCITVADQERTRASILGIDHRFERVVYLEQLSTEQDAVRGESPPEFVAADAMLRQRIEATAREGVVSRGMWESMLAEGEAPDLEPFVAFGPAIEMAIWADGDEREGPRGPVGRRDRR
jgi:hypothetical protein